MIKRLSPERGKLIYAHEVSAKPRRVTFATVLELLEPLKSSPKPSKILRNHSKFPKIFACGAMKRLKPP